MRERSVKMGMLQQSPAAAHKNFSFQVLESTFAAGGCVNQHVIGHYKISHAISQFSYKVNYDQAVTLMNR